MAEGMAAVLDSARLLSLSDEIGDAGVVREAVATFVTEVPNRLEDIRTAVANQNFADIRSAAHALGSPASMLGADAVRASTRAMQDAARDGRIEEFAPLTLRITSDAERTVAAMLDYLGSA